MSAPPAEPYTIAVRAYGVPAKERPPARPQRRLSPSDLVLVFDCETTTDAAQQLRFGSYQLRDTGVLVEHGLFYDPLTLSQRELRLLTEHARRNKLEIQPVAEWIDRVFYGIAYDLGAIVIGFNLPFDLSRLAIRHANSQGSMRGGFTFWLSEDPDRPPVRVKHLSRRSALIDFTAPRRQITPRSMRQRAMKVPPHRGHFIDVSTIGAALTGEIHSLESLSHLLKVEHPKEPSDEHGGPLTDQYIAYGLNDVQATWESFEVLRDRYESWHLDTAITAIYSEASVGKSYLQKMRVRPWQRKEYSPELIGRIMSTYYGGRAEVHLRRVVTRVLYCDFLSMYPTVCSLMDLWQFVIASGFDYDESGAATTHVRNFLETVTLADLQRPATWHELRALVQVEPDADIFPVRTRYGADQQYNIGVNYLTSPEPMWFTLADCVQSKLLTGKSPKIRQAIRFTPRGPQRGLHVANIAGQAEYRVRPLEDDFYRKLIDLRREVKGRRDTAKSAGDQDTADRLDAEQQALKITANATSYGIFVELNVEDLVAPQAVTCYGSGNVGFTTPPMPSVERAGQYFHPLLATFITGAARLMLAIVERLTIDAGLDWTFCDTDSMAIARPDGMLEEEFLARATPVREWFTDLNPYDVKAPLFQLEDANRALRGDKLTDAIGELYCYAIAAKRYALFNRDGRNRPVLRKASAHGLGHLSAPYAAKNAPSRIPAPKVKRDDLGVDRWEHDLWYQLISAALRGEPNLLPIDRLPGFEKHAVTDYAATTPEQLKWFRQWNQEKPYREQVRPFGFLCIFHPVTLAERAVAASGAEIRDEEASQPGSRRSLLYAPRPTAPFDRDPEVAVVNAFDRETGEAVSPSSLRTYRQALNQYHLHPEPKFLNADYLDVGTASRRHVLFDGIDHIGKEANRWEEQFYLGEEPDAQIVYGGSWDARRDAIEHLRAEILGIPDAELSRIGDIARRTLSNFRNGVGEPSPRVLAAIRNSVRRLRQREERSRAEEQALIARAIEQSSEVGLRRLARIAGVPPGPLSEVLNGRRGLSEFLAERLRSVLDAPP